MVEVSSVVLEKKSFKGKVYRQQTDGRQTVADTYSSLEHSVQVN